MVFKAAMYKRKEGSIVRTDMSSSKQIRSTMHAHTDGGCSFSQSYSSSYCTKACARAVLVVYIVHLFLSVRLPWRSLSVCQSTQSLLSYLSPLLAGRRQKLQRENDAKG
mmetsp:Transcript_30657/g.60334  ORF Transcript_30657/g.60334 Transcript_30657/m.60334 type:complete len:109 (-) Transcript_30657:475-801(-)